MITLSRPLHRKYALGSVSDETYINFLNGYSIAKKGSVKGVWIYISGSGVAGLCKAALKQEAKRWGYRKIATGALSCLTWAGTPLIPLITNSTKIIRLANMSHTTIAFFAETCEDCTGLAWLPIDLILCGQPVPMGDAGRYNLMGGNEATFPFFCD
jgi:hypothetical protein